MGFGAPAILEAVTGEVITAERMQRFVTKANWVASNQAFGLSPFRVVNSLAEGTGVLAGRGWYIRHKYNRFHIRIDVPLIAADAFWDLRVNSVVVAGGNNAEGMTSFNGTKTLSGLTIGAIYAVEFRWHHPSGGSSVANIVWLYQSLAPTSWTLPGTSGTPTAANYNTYMNNLAELEQSVEVSRPPFHAVIQSEIEWFFQGESEIEIGRWNQHHLSNTLAAAIEVEAIGPDGLNDDPHEIRLYVDDTLVAHRETSAADGGNERWEGTIDLTSFGFSEGDKYMIHATLQQQNVSTNLSPEASARGWVYYALEIDGNPPASYVPPGAWEPCDDWQGSSGDPNVAQLNTALTDLNSRVPGHPNYATPAEPGGVFAQRRRDFLYYRGTAVLAWADTIGGLPIIDPTQGQSTTLPYSEDGASFPLGDIPIGSIYLVTVDGSIPEGQTLDYAIEDDL